MYSFKKLR